MFFLKIYDDSEIEERFIRINNCLQNENTSLSFENCIFVPKPGLFLIL